MYEWMPFEVTLKYWGVLVIILMIGVIIGAKITDILGEANLLYHFRKNLIFKLKDNTVVELVEYIPPCCRGEGEEH